MSTLIYRHIKLFLKDKASVFFSLFSVLIIMLLYILFLSENLMSNLPTFENQQAFVFLWMLAGIIAVTTATATLGAFGKYMEDRVSRKSEDLLMTPITTCKLAYSYIYYSFFIGSIFTIFLLIFGYIYTYMQFTIILPFSLRFFAIILLSTFMHTLIFYLIATCLKTMSSFGGFSTIAGTLIGFLTGIYIPIGLLPSYLQKIITIFPTTQVTVLLKELLMKEVLEPIQSLIPEQSYNELMMLLGNKLHWNGKIIPYEYSWCYLLGFTLFLFILVILKNSRQNI